MATCCPRAPLAGSIAAGGGGGTCCVHCRVGWGIQGSCLVVMVWGFGGMAEFLLPGSLAKPNAPAALVPCIRLICSVILPSAVLIAVYIYVYARLNSGIHFL